MTDPIEIVQGWAETHQGLFAFSGGRWSADLTEEDLVEFVEHVLADPHDGDTCEEIERQLDDAVGELNWISYNLARRGYKIDCREKSVADWVLELLPKKRKRWWRR